MSFITTDDTAANEHLLLDVAPYNLAGDRSYLRLGDWDGASEVATNGGLFTTSCDAATITVDDRGDDLLAAFHDSRYLDDTRDRDDPDGADGGAAGFTDYAPLAEQPHEPSSIDDGGLSPAQRQTMTNAIPGGVGWRDHTEGHRITTTRGDKVEVIGGNYKLIVLGRGQGTATSDWSGGMRIDTLEAPGNVTSINYRKVPVLNHSAYDGAGIDEADRYSWQWVEETIKGHVIERYHGTYQEELYGDSMITIIGRDPSASADTAAAAPDDQSKGGFDDAMVYDGTIRPVWDDVPSGADNQVRLLNPAIKERVHARSIFTAEYIDDEKVDVEYAAKIHDYMGCTPDFDDDHGVRSKQGRQGFGADPDMKVAKVASGSWAHRPEEVVEYVMASKISTATNCTRMYGRVGTGSRPANIREDWNGDYTREFRGNYLQWFWGLSSTVGFANRFEIFVGAEQQVNLGSLSELAVAFPINKHDIFFGLKYDMGIGHKSELLFKENETVAKLSDTLFVATKAALKEYAKQGGMRRLALLHALS